MFNIDFDSKEYKKAKDLIDDCRKVKQHQTGEKTPNVEYHYEYHPGSIGPTIYLVIPEFKIYINITDYESW